MGFGRGWFGAAAPPLALGARPYMASKSRSLTSLALWQGSYRARIARIAPTGKSSLIFHPQNHTCHNLDVLSVKDA